VKYQGGDALNYSGGNNIPLDDKEATGAGRRGKSKKRRCGKVMATGMETLGREAPSPAFPPRLL
jgi:hypothetical protein